MGRPPEGWKPEGFTIGVNDEQKKDEGQKREEEISPDVAKKIQQLREAHANWKGLTNRGKLNVNWLQKNGYHGLYSWTLKHGGIYSLVSLAGGEVAESFERSKVERTSESCVEELRTAHAAWKALPEAERGTFNTSWLQKNGYVAFYTWASRHGGGVARLISLAGGEVAQDFERSRIDNRTTETAIEEFRAAHAVWKALPEVERKPFNINWLQKNGYSGFGAWLTQNGGGVHFAALAGGNVVKDFEQNRTDRDLETAIEEFRVAHAVWKALPESGRGRFNINWLEKGDYSGLISWIRKNGEIESFVSKVGGEVARDFERNRTDRDLETAIEEFRAAHAVWKALPESGRGRFNLAWLQKNGYASLQSWIIRKRNADALVALASGEIAQDFERKMDYTAESVVDDLRTAHAAWKALPEAERGTFNTSWLEKGDYSGLISWIRKNGEIESFVSKVGGEVAQDFEINRIDKRTSESAVQELRAAHAKWKALPEIERGKFIVSWLQNNGYNGLYQWLQKRDISISVLAFQAGGEVAQDFKKGLKEKIPKQDLIDYVSGLEKEGIQSEEFKKLLNIFGSSRCLDILYKFRPEFKSLPHEYVNGILADYLGDFLTIKTGFKPKDLEVAVEFLSDVTFQDALYETIKDDCFRYYIVERRSRRAEAGQSVIYGYLDHMVEQVGHINNRDLDNIIQKVLLYYDSVLRDFHKPERFVDALSSEREFPDINQRINMKELADKKRLLIADEMGLGKSASVIMAKEQLGVKCALVVAPSNVLETWQRYLSESSKGGYFKEGEAPRVLVVEDPAQAGQASTEDYDYILVSQERMTDRYADVLKGMNFDMMIVDEVHKFKKPEGVRASYLTELTQKIEGEDKYLALLSGTPVPNKIQDLGLILKLLYPEKFAAMDDRELVRNIVRGDVLDLRSLLLPRMQMKDLQEGVEMPELVEITSEIELSDIEKRVYEVLLEDDELTATEKMIILRTFLMNPEVVDATPGIVGAKLETLNQKLDEVFETQDKIVVFVNDYMEGIVWGEGNIVEKLSLPPDTDVRVIYGNVTKTERKQIEKDLKTTNGKMLLVVSGQTADVGVDFSAADKVIFYNEPWTEYQKRQEVGRVYRPGLSHDLESDTLIVRGTIEEGIHQHIQKKYKVIEKLLRGIPTTELDKALVMEDEKDKEPDVSVNEELARYYFSSWDNLMRMFSYVKEIGEEDFRKFLEKYGKDYAGSYVNLGNRSYQSNANRITGTMFHKMAEQRGQSSEETRILDLASGPEMLKRHIGDEHQRQVVSIDINKEHFLGREGENRVIGSLGALPFNNDSFDYANASLSFHYTSLVPSKGKFERLQVLREMNRVLKPEGRVVINLIYSLDVKDREKFAEAVQEFGFQLVEDYTGTIRSGTNYTSQVITLEKIKDIDYEVPIAELAEGLGKEKLNGLKFKQTAEKIKDPRRVVTSFELGGTTHEVMLNARDQEVREEEQNILAQGEALKQSYKDIKFIPNQEIIDNNFIRIRVGKKYVLFKKLTKGAGVVIVK